MLSTTYSCCHSHNVIESMTSDEKKKKKERKKKIGETFGILKEGHDTINNTQRGPPGNPTIVNVATQPTQQQKPPQKNLPNVPLPARQQKADWRQGH